MSNEEIIEWFESSKNDSIVGYIHERKEINEEIIEISKDSLTISKNKDAFWYFWGWPGPDANYYKFEDYGITWAFTKEELE